MRNNYLIVPYSILELPELNLSQKIVLAEIISLTRIRGVCFASNKFLADRCRISERTVSTSIKKLLSEEYITVEIKRNNTRNIRLKPEKLNEKSIFIPAAAENTDREEKEKGIEKTSIPEENNSNPIENTSTYKNIYNNKNNNIYNYNKNSNNFGFNRKSNTSPESSYNLEELMVIR